MRNLGFSCKKAPNLPFCTFLALFSHFLHAFSHFPEGKHNFSENPAVLGKMRKHCEKSAKKVQKQCETLVSAAKELPNLGGEAILHFFNLFSHIFALSLWKTLFFRKSSSAWENATKCKKSAKPRFHIFPRQNTIFPKMRRKCGKCAKKCETYRFQLQKRAPNPAVALYSHFIYTLFALYLHFCVLSTPSTYTLFTLYLHFICTSVSSQPLPLTLCSHFICTLFALLCPLNPFHLHFVHTLFALFCMLVTFSSHFLPEAPRRLTLYLQFICK